jgi:hypothetical protein
MGGKVQDEMQNKSMKRVHTEIKEVLMAGHKTLNKISL